MKKALLFSGLLLAVNVLFAQWTTSGSNVYLTTSSNNVGVGTSSPAFKLDVTGVLHDAGALIVDGQTSGGIIGWFRGVASGDANVVLQGDGGSWPAFWISGTQTYLKIGANGGTEPATGAINVDGSGHVGINTLNTAGFNFSVNGTAVFDQVTVETFSGNNPNASPWADYVFDKDYQLPSIYSIADYIKANNHLPGIPTTAEVKKNGLNLGATQAKLLEKIEQLTLYTIQMQQQIDSMHQQIDSLKTVDDKYAILQQEIDELKRNARQ